MAVTDDFKADVLEVLNEYSAALENQTGVPFLDEDEIDETVSMPAVKYDKDPATHSDATPNEYRQVPMATFFNRIDKLANTVDEATSDLNTLKTQTAAARDNAQTAADNANDSREAIELNEHQRQLDEQTRQSQEQARVTEFATLKATAESVTATTKAQGETAKAQGATAKTQGEYAKEQGDYAKQRGDYPDQIRSDSYVWTYDPSSSSAGSDGYRRTEYKVTAYIDYNALTTAQLADLIAKIKADLIIASTTTCSSIIGELT